MTKRYEVVVVGAGLAGLQCARLLAERSIPVLIVDRKPDLHRPIHTTGIFVRRTLEDFRIPAALLGPSIRHVTLHSPGGRQQSLESPHDEFRIGRMGPMYESMIRDAQRAGAETLRGAHFRGLEERGERLLVSLEVEGSPIPVWTQYIVGADGAASRVASALGLSTNSETIVGVEDVLHGVPLEGPPMLHCYLDPGLAPGYIGWVAHDGHEMHLGVGGYADAFSPAGSLAALRHRVARDFDISRGTLAERRGGRIPVGGVLPNISCRSGLLTGDAAGAVSPLTAGGLDGAMRLSRYAAEVLATAVEQDDPDVLSLYDGVRLDTRLVSRRWMRCVLTSVRSPLLVEAGCALLRTPPLAAFAWQIFFGRRSFPEPDRGPLRVMELDRR